MALSSDPLSPSSITSSMSSTGKRRRRTTRKNDISIPSPSSSILEDDEQQKQEAELIINAQQQEQQKFIQYHGGDAVEAVKLTDDAAKQWYCARVVDTDDSLVLVHYEGFPADEADWVSQTLVRPRSTLMIKKQRQQKQGLISQQPKELYGPRGEEDWKDFVQPANRMTGLVHDRRMGLHSCPCSTISHPERPERITSIFNTLHHHRVLRYVRHIVAREASVSELQRVHAKAHVRNYSPNDDDDHNNDANDDDEDENDDPNPRAHKITSIEALLNKSEDDNIFNKGYFYDKQQKQQKQINNNNKSDGRRKMVCGQIGIAGDTTFHPLHTSLSARVAAGSLINLTDAIVDGRIRNGFAAIRPPGHHAEQDKVMGYCYFNNVAVATQAVLKKYPSKIRKVLILDWDIHHGNGTQQIFYDNPNVLYISIHRWDQGRFYPFSGAPDECGRSAGLGRNVNIALSNCKEKPKPMGDTEFMAAIHHIVTPIARQFGPDLIYVSAGFDAAEGHSPHLGGYHVTPRGYALMTKMVKELAEELCDGRLALVLEGGYELEPLAESATASIIQLCDIPNKSISSYQGTLTSIKPNRGASTSFHQVIEHQRQHWDLPELPTDFRFLLPQEWKTVNSISSRLPRRQQQQQQSQLYTTATNNNKQPVIHGY
ncbi:hypothetical protein INT45_004939 [Circinella minor]|uniref:histone deacetylase n=1 Tax=Circinella minor TaxID=1195481 RepID=A0A8H7S8N2_9FUNG|nr:hypothetical protein INT45_004939 [Circinella minor]